MKPIFIGGCGRSGTTLLGAMLGSHPRYLATPEAKFNVAAYLESLQARGTLDTSLALAKIKAHWSFRILGVELASVATVEPASAAAYADVVRAIVEQYGRRVGKVRPDVWIDHTPDNILSTQPLFDLYPDAKVIHMVRDGRAVAASVMKLDWGPNTVDTAARWWIQSLAHGFAAELGHAGERVMRVRYEDLVQNPAGTLQTLCTFLEIDYHPAMLQGAGFQAPVFTSQGHELVGSRPDPSRIGAWRSTLHARQIEIFESIAGAMLRHLDYDLVTQGHARAMTGAEEMRTIAIELYRQTANRLHRRQRIARAISAAADGQTPKTIAQNHLPMVRE